MLTEDEFKNIVRAEVQASVGYSGQGSTIHANRAKLLDSYNTEPYGNEVKGRSSTISADVFNTIEGALPPLVRLFTQNQKTAIFRPTHPAFEEEAKQKTELANYIFSVKHDPVYLISSHLKDGMLQYTGILEVCWDESDELLKLMEFDGLDEEQVTALKIREENDDQFVIVDVKQEDEGFTVKAKKVNPHGRAKIEPVPPNEFVISKRARSFDDTPLIGKNTPKTRSELKKMGFDPEIVDALGTEQAGIDSVASARTRDLGGNVDTNPSEDRSKDIFRLGQYYIKLDNDEDGEEELWLVYYVEDGNTILSKEEVDYQPFCPYTNIPMPNRAIGTCIAHQVNDYQFWKTTLIRHLNDNIYSTNYARAAINENVNKDDFLNPRHGGVVRVAGKNPPSNSILPFSMPQQTSEILQAIEYIDTLIEIRTGVTRYNQGLDTESLNKTATGFQGIREMSQMKSELNSRIYSEALKKVFQKIVELYSKHFKTQMEIPVGTSTMVINPTSWEDRSHCNIDIGNGSGDRNQEVAVLNALLEQQKAERGLGSNLVDQKKIYNTYQKLVVATGLKEIGPYFNDPEQPQELLLQEVERLTRENQLLQQQMQNPLAEAEAIKQQATTEREILKIQTKAQVDGIKLDQDDRHHDDQMALELTKIEAETNKDVPGALI